MWWRWPWVNILSFLAKLPLAEEALVVEVVAAIKERP
jgi:hypothetical protein